MNAILPLLALLLVPQDESELRKRIEEIETMLPEIDKKIREAIDRGDPDAAVELNQEHKDARKELESLQERLRKIEEERPKKRDWYRSLNLEGQFLLTHWDNDLEVHDGTGWGAAAYVRDFIWFEYRQWEAEDELNGGDAEIRSYVLGFTSEFSLSEGKTSTLRIGCGFGLIRFDSDGMTGDTDTGWIWSVTPQWKHYLSRRLRLNLGGDVDLLRTDFNQNHTHTNHNFTLLLSAELAF